MPEDHGTIVGEATPPGRGALRVLRLSGPLAAPILRAVFMPRGRAPWESARQLCLGDVRGAGGVVLDVAMAVLFPAPASLTGEDVAELQVHGSPGVVRALVDAAVGLGARPALPGEFTYRAFLNGKMDLLEAETVQALVAAKTEGQAAAVAAGFRGGAGREVAAIRESLLDLLASWEARIDFPEDVEGGGGAGEEAEAVWAVAARLERLGESARGLRCLREGWRVALVGAVNTGKSSLFNALLRRERALVTPHPGTTRDVLEESIEVAGYPLVLVDTAGVREASDPVEALGVSAGLRAAAEADGVLLVYDGSLGWREEDRGLLESLREPPLAILANKRDLGPVGDAWPGALGVSARTGEGLEALSESLRRWVEARAPEGRDRLVSERQAAQVRRALDGVRDAHASLSSGGTEEVAAQGLRTALEALDGLVGGGDPEDLYDRIFSSFCIGK